MNKKISRILSIVFVFAFFAMVIFSLNKFLPNNSKIKADTNSAATVTYRDWSELGAVDNNYSYSTLFYTKDTEFYVNANQNTYTSYSGDVEDTVKYYRGFLVDQDKTTPGVKLSSGGKAQIIITNCAMNKSGKLINAVFDIDVKNAWRDHSYIEFFVNRIALNRGTQDNPYLIKDQGTDNRVIDYNMPFQFNLSTSYAEADVTLTYYSKLDIQKDPSKDYYTPYTGVPSGYKVAYGKVLNTSVIDTSITHVNSFYDDIDTMASNSAHQEVISGKLFDGNEGVGPLNGTSNIYYKKSQTISTAYSNPEVVLSTKIKESNGTTKGVYIEDNTFTPEMYANDFTTQGLLYFNSTEFLTTGLQGVYKFTYTGWGCGIGFIFFSPQAYSYDAPVKTASKTSILPGDELTYTIKQYIPNNYFSTIVDFSSVYSNINNGKLSTFSINDVDMDGDLVIDSYSLSNIEENLSNSSSYSINVEEGTNHISASVVNSSVYNNPSFYNNTLSLDIKVHSNKSYSSVKTLTNKAYTAIKPSSATTETKKYSNNVNVQISSPKVTYDCQNGETDHIISYYNPNSDVDLSLTCQKDDRMFAGWSQNKQELLSTLKMGREDITIYALYKPIIEVETVNQTKVYDGEPLVASEAENDCKLKSGTLKDGYRIECTYYGSITNVGNSTKSIIANVFDSDNNNVTSEYDIRTISGKLTITPKPITVFTSNEAKVYDTLPLVALNDCGSNDLVGNDEIACTNEGSITNVGNVTKEIKTIKINNQDLEDSNYVIETITNGKLTIKPKKITVSTTSQEKVYSKLELVVNNDCTTDDLLGDDTITCKIYGELNDSKVYQIKDVMTIPKKIDTNLVKINDQNIQESNYEIENVVNATLKITPISIKIKATDQSKKYDRTPLLANEVCELIDNTSILEDQVLKCTSSGSQTSVGSSVKTLQTVKVLDENNVDVSGNYTIAKNDGQLLVTPLVNKITLDDNEATIPGTLQIYEICDDAIALDNNKENIMTSDDNPIMLPTKTGYTFAGYYSTNDEDGILVIDKNGYKTDDLTYDVCVANRIIYAKWIPNKYKLTVIYNNGKENDTYELSYKETKEINNPEKKLYTFKEWKLTGEGSKFENKVFTMGYEDATLEAIYEKSPVSCDTILTSDLYKIEQETKTVHIEENITVEEIKKHITSKGVIASVTEKEVIVRCEDKEEVYKIVRYWVPKTGQTLVDYLKIFGYFGIILVLLFIIKKQIDKNGTLK